MNKLRIKSKKRLSKEEYAKIVNLLAKNVFDKKIETLKSGAVKYLSSLVGDQLFSDVGIDRVVSERLINDGYMCFSNSVEVSYLKPMGKGSSTLICDYFDIGFDFPLKRDNVCPIIFLSSNKYYSHHTRGFDYLEKNNKILELSATKRQKNSLQKKLYELELERIRKGKFISQTKSTLLQFKTINALIKEISEVEKFVEIYTEEISRKEQGKELVPIGSIIDLRKMLSKVEAL